MTDMEGQDVRSAATQLHPQRPTTRLCILTPFYQLSQQFAKAVAVLWDPSWRPGLHSPCAATSLNLLVLNVRLLEFLTWNSQLNNRPIGLQIGSFSEYRVQQMITLSVQNRTFQGAFHWPSTRPVQNESSELGIVFRRVTRDDIII